MERMKILHIINDLGSGGAEKLIADFVPLMKEKGHDVDIISIIKADCVYCKELQEKGINVTYLSENKLYSLKHVFSIREYIKRGEFDIVHVHLFPAFYFTGLASILGIDKSKLVYSEHSTFNRRRNSKIFRYFDKKIYKRYNAIIAVSKGVKESLINYLKYEDKHIDVIFNGVNIDKFKNSKPVKIERIIKNYQKGDRIICMVGRISIEKDHSTLIKAISLLSENIKLIIIGEGPLEDKCVLLSKNLKIADRVYFLGFRTDIPKILKACDVGVLSSNWEGLPVFALEVFASGIPFIGSDVPGINDFFNRETKLELLFKNKDSNSLSILIKQILENESVKNRNIEICQKIVNKFSLGKMTDLYLKLYKELL